MSHQISSILQFGPAIWSSGWAGSPTRKRSWLRVATPLSIVLTCIRGYNCMPLAQNLKLFSIRVKELFEPIVLWRRGVLALFISIFLRNRSLSDARWFYGKTRTIGKGNLYLTENHQLSWNEMYKRIFKFELQLQMLLLPNALCCSLYERNCVCAVTKNFTKFLPTNNFCQLLRVTRKP